MKIMFEAKLPVRNTSAWLVGAEVSPSLSHTEVETAEQAKTGTGNSSNSIGAWFGKKTVFDRKNQVYWKVHHKIEKNLFSWKT